MKLAHNVKLTVFSYEGEDSSAISSKLSALCPFDLNEEKVELKTTVATGFSEKKIIIFEIFLTKEKHTNRFLKSMREQLSDDQRTLLVRQAESRLDSDLNFFIRLDKQKWMEEDRVWITDSGNCFHLKINVAAFPSNRENALKIVNGWLS